jgi:hypothetical protein
MLVCLRAMGGHTSHQQAATAPARGLPDSSPDGTAERIATLERELAELRADQDRAAGQPYPSAAPATSSAHPAKRQPSANPPTAGPA